MSKIEWTDATWNPTTGCNKVSKGCKNCYAEVMHKRLAGMGQAKYQQPFLKGVVTHESELLKPLGWKKPRMVFVNSMSDLFHEDVPFDFIDKVFAIMALTPQHTYQILTKRADRMAEYFEGNEREVYRNCEFLNFGGVELPPRVLPNVWLGVSVEDQKAADERIPHLLNVPAAVRFLSCEPLLGKINISPFLAKIGIHWVICGGESGSKARPMHPDWVRSLRHECKRAGVAFFFKQWGEWMPDKEFFSLDEIQADIDYGPDIHSIVQLIDFYGMHNDRLLIDGFTKPLMRVLKVGKKKAGRSLDGVTHDGFPVVKEVVV